MIRRQRRNFNDSASTPKSIHDGVGAAVEQGVVEVSTGLFLVTRTRGPGWDVARPLEAQELWAEHAEFMMALVHDGFVTLGGPIAETPEVLLVVKAASVQEAERRLALDPWTLSGHLRIARIQSWELRLGTLA
jgi:hypothetical protein